MYLLPGMYTLLHAQQSGSRLRCGAVQLDRLDLFIMMRAYYIYRGVVMISAFSKASHLNDIPWWFILVACSGELFSPRVTSGQSCAQYRAALDVARTTSWQLVGVPPNMDDMCMLAMLV